MKTQSALSELEKRLGGAPPTTPAAGFQAMLEFYESVRAEDVDIDSDGDMLLFQWGTYDLGSGRRFQVDLTRQLMLDGGEDGDIWQLHLTYSAPPTSDTAALGSGNTWCASPGELPAFRTHVLSHGAVAELTKRSDAAVELRFECAG